MLSYYVKQVVYPNKSDKTIDVSGFKAHKQFQMKLTLAS